MTQEQLAKVKALLIKKGYKESGMTKNWFFTEDGSDRAADLRKENPIVGILISGNIVTSGHGNLKVEDDIREVEAIMKSKEYTLRHPPGDEIEPPVDKEKLKEAFQKIQKSPSSVTERQQKQPANIQENEYRQTETPNTESKLGAGDTHAKIRMCRKCGIEVSHARALACLGNNEPCTCEDCGEKQKESNQKEKIMDEKLPAKKEEAKLPAKKTDAEIDEMIELAKAEKFLKGQGGSYSVSGKNRPDSAMVQKIANAADISCEILEAEQTKEYAHVVVRGHRGNNYVDAVVHHDFETEFQLQTMEIIKKNPQILDHYDGLIPVMKEGAFIVLNDRQVDAKYHLIHTLLSFKTFSLRDATTKAMQIVQSKLLNQDPRTKEEVASEQKESDLVEEKRNQKR